MLVTGNQQPFLCLYYDLLPVVYKSLLSEILVRMSTKSSGLLDGECIKILYMVITVYHSALLYICIQFYMVKQYFTK